MGLVDFFWEFPFEIAHFPLSFQHKKVQFLCTDSQIFSKTSRLFSKSSNPEGNYWFIEFWGQNTINFFSFFAHECLQKWSKKPGVDNDLILAINCFVLWKPSLIEKQCFHALQIWNVLIILSFSLVRYSFCNRWNYIAVQISEEVCLMHEFKGNFRKTHVH